ncbi:MAG: trypsin-like peptidase domain-containing protein, partial [Kiritimatiellae bacterium]|nr:trypsin-like peptidase domain-containing protein [Kiritimatiellia bacterium]
LCSHAQVEDLQRAVKATIQDAHAGVVEVWAYTGNGPVGASTSSERHTHFERLLQSGVDVAPPAKGSGFVVSTNGLIVTAGHLVREARHVVVQTASSTRYRAEVALIDEDHDLALLKTGYRTPTPLRFRASEKLPVAGEFVLAIGYPFGLGQSASLGIVSAAARQIDAANGLRLIQTDAAVNSGNSGGPLVGLDGGVVGMQNVALAVNGVHSGIGFAVPSDVIEAVIRSMTHPLEGKDWLGILLTTVADEVRIAYVVPNSPADKAGLRRGQQIVRVDDVLINSVDLARLRIGNSAVGQDVDLELADRSKVKIKVSPRPVSYRFDSGLHHNARSVGARPLTQAEDDALLTSLDPLVCSCDQRTLLTECQNCSAAKSVYSFARDRIISGDKVDQVKLRIAAPLHLTAWVDFSQEQSRSVVRCLEKLNSTHIGLVRLTYRHFPANSDTVEGWRYCVNAIEVARVYGQENQARQLLVTKHDGDWKSRALSIPEKTRVPKPAFEEAMSRSRFEKQIWKDLTEGPAVHKVKASPALFFGASRYQGPVDGRRLLHAVDAALLEKCL